MTAYIHINVFLYTYKCNYIYTFIYCNIDTRQAVNRDYLRKTVALSLRKMTNVIKQF